MRGWALGDVPQADAVSLRFLEGLPQAPEDIRVVLGRGEVAGVDSQGVERIGQHGFPCGLRHPPPCRPEAAVLHRPLAGPMDQALEGGLSPGLLPQLPELRVGPAWVPVLSAACRARWACVGMVKMCARSVRGLLDQRQRSAADDVYSAGGCEGCLGPSAGRMVGGGFCMCQRGNPARLVALGGVLQKYVVPFPWGAPGPLGTVVVSVPRRVPGSPGTQ